ncbi:MAG: hypothetical protein II529_00355 [Erysipelotrichaceae bacterium]|nr:hypothetical protein [Erysipelotrichaceae bacterium]
MIVCKNCGGEFDGRLSKCPYCGTMHKAGAYRNFRQKISDLIDTFLGLKEEVDRSVSQSIFFSLLRAILIVCIVIGAAFGASLLYNTNYYNDREYDEERLEDILWGEENLEKLDRAFIQKDFKTIKTLIYENRHVASTWEHYDAFLLLDAYDNIRSEENLEEYYLRDCLYFLFYPEFYGNPGNMNEEDLGLYEANRAELLDLLSQKGYSESELHSIYDRHADSYGYLNISDLKKYVKGENNG